MWWKEILDKIISIQSCTQFFLKKIYWSCNSIAYSYPAVQEIVHLPLLLPWRLQGKSISSAVFVIQPSFCRPPAFLLLFPSPTYFFILYPNFPAFCFIYLCFMQKTSINAQNITITLKKKQICCCVSFLYHKNFFAQWLIKFVCD